MRDGNQPAARVAAEVGDPAVVRATVRTRELGVEQLSLPEEAERGIEHGLCHPLAVEELHALLHVHGAERGAAEVRLIRRETDAADVLRRDVPAHRAIAQFPRLVDPLAHPAERAELARAGDRGAPAVDLQEFEAVVTHAYPERPVAIGGFQVALPQIRRFKDVAVAVDHELVDRHRVLLRPRSAQWLAAGPMTAPPAAPSAVSCWRKSRRSMGSGRRGALPAEPVDNGAAHHPLEVTAPEPR